MKVALVTSPHLDHTIYHHSDRRGPDGFATAHVAQRFAPMGLISLAEATSGLSEPSILDFNKCLNSGELPLTQHFYDAAAEWILSGNPDLVGFMTECDSYHHLLRVCRQIKKRRPSVSTLLGGVHATAAHRETLEEFPEIDLIIRGEGEVAFRQLVEALVDQGDLRNVGNLTHRRGDTIVSNEMLPLISDLDTLPWPEFSRFPLAAEDVVYLEIGRGCPFKCNFCFTAPYWQRKHRIKSAGRVIAELRYLKTNYGRADFNFTHDLLTTDRRWVIDFCRQLSETDLAVTWTCSSRTDTIDDEQLEWLRRAGCRNIYYGVEAGTAEMQARIDKNLDLEQADRNIRQTVGVGIGVTVGFIAGLPGESARTLHGSLDRAFRYLALPDSTVHMFAFNSYRGSAIHDALKPELRFDEHFVDFPLPEEIHAENCALMAPLFSIFSRYWRITEYHDLQPSVVRAADEFFPIVNPLRNLILAIVNRDVDSLEMLKAWALWIEQRNLARRSPTARLYQGSIADFLAFAEEWLTTTELLDSALSECLRWERLKNEVRGYSYRPLALGYMPDSSMNLLYTNPTVHVDHFARAAPTHLPGDYAFYLHANGEGAIVRLTPIAAVILEAARNGGRPEELATVIQRVMDGDLPSDRFVATGALDSLLDQLEKLELLLSPAVAQQLISVA